MRKNLMTLLIFMLSNGFQKINEKRELYRELTQLRLKLLYINVIKTCRFLFLSILGVGVFLVFLLTSLIILNVTLFFYVPYTMETKMCLGFVSAAVYLLIAGAAFNCVFSQKKWLAIFHAGGLLNNVNGTSVQKSS